MVKLAQASIQKYKLTIFISVIMMGLGIYSFVLIPKQDMPEIVPPFSSIQLIAPGYGINDVLEYVTEPVENAILSVEGVDYVDTITLDNVAIFNVFLFVDEVNTQPIFDQVMSEINAVSLPSGVMDPISNNILMSPHAVFSVSSKTLTKEALTEIAENFANQLGDIDNVSTIKITGSSDIQAYVNVNYQALNTIGLTMNDLVNIIQYGGLEIPIGTIITQDGAMGIKIPANYTSVEAVNQIVIGMNGNVPIFVSDVAKVELRENPKQPLYVENEETTVFLELFFESGIDFTVLGNELIEVQEAFQSDFTEVNIEQMTFQPDVVKESLNQVYSSLIIGIVLVVVIIFIGLGIRNAIGVAITFPLILLGTMASMFFLDQELQKVTIAALIITIGIIVDNAIVISESIQYHIDQGKNRLEASLLSVKENSLPVLSSSLTTIAAFIPFMVIGGATGKMIRALPITVSVAIGISYFVAMLLVPVFGAYFFKKTAVKKQKVTPQWIQSFYKKMLPAIIKKPKIIILSSLILLVVSLGIMVVRSPFELFPVEDDNVIYIDYKYSDINDQVGAHAYVLDIIDVLSEFEEIYYTAYSVGGDLPNFGARSQINDVPGEGRIFFRLDVPFAKIESYVEEFKEILSLNENIASQGSLIVKQLSMNFGGDADVSIALSSYDYNILMDNILEVSNALSDLDVVNKVSVQEQKTQQNIQVNINRNQLMVYGLSMIEVQQQIATNINGGSYSIFEYHDRLIQLNIVTSTPSLEAFEMMQVKSSKTGQFVPLSNIAKFEIVDGIQMIQRHNGDYQVLLDVFFNEGVNAVVETNTVINVVKSTISDDVTLSLGGQAELRNETFTTLGIASVVALIVVYFILFVQFDSFKVPFIILITVPLSLIGSGLLVGLTATPISFTMIFGITSLIGIVVNMGILLIDYINRAREEGDDVLAACVSAVERRLRPILLSSVTTIMGLIPLALFGGAFFTPMAVSLIGGLIASTILTIFVIPTAYYFIENKK